MNLATGGGAAAKNSSGSGASRASTLMDDHRWRQRMQGADVADELFFPTANSHWLKTRFRLLKGHKPEARTRMTGIRFLAADPARENKEPERATQNDFSRLIGSLIKIRQVEECERMCLSGQTFKTSPRRDVTRLRFGLDCRKGKRAADDRVAARRAYKTVRRSIRRAGFVVEEPTRKFDPRTGLVGLQDWTSELRLRKRRMWWLWLLLLPLLLLIPKCEPPASFFGAPIQTESFLVLIDRSGSMAKHFGALQSEVHRVTGKLLDIGSASMNVIAYDSQAESCLGKIQPIDGPVRERIEKFLAGLQSGGGTNLESGLSLAAKEIAAHGEPTTLIILTDAEDSSIAGMIAEKKALVDQFKNIRIHSYGLTPRLFGPPSGKAEVPETPSENKLSELAEILGGRFGPTESTR